MYLEVEDQIYMVWPLCACKHDDTLRSILLGVEPWTFYFFNGLLNFNGVFVLAMATGLLVETKVHLSV